MRWILFNQVLESLVEFEGMKNTIGDHVLIKMRHNHLVLVYFYSLYLYDLLCYITLEIY